MAFYSDELENENEIDPGQGFQIGPMGGSLNAGAPSSSVSGTGSSKAPDNPGNFVGIKQYLDANRPQANKFGEQVGGQISSKVDTAQQNIAGFNPAFEQEANKGLIKGFDTAQQEATGITNKAATGGLGALPSQEEKTRFGEIANASYSGPKTAQEAGSVYNPVYQSVQEAQKLADLSKSEEGSQELVRNVANKESPYTKGSARLDSYLLNTQENRKRLEDARKSAETLQPSLTEAVNKAGEYGSNLQKKTDELKSTVQNLLANTAMGKRSAVESALSQREQQINDFNQRLQNYRNLLADTSDGGSIKLTPAQMQELGLSEGQRLYGALNTDPNAFLPGQASYDPNTAISREDQARLSALAELAGTYGGDFTNPFTMPDLAGTSGELPTIDPSRLQSEIAKRKAAYDKAYNSERIRNEIEITNPGNPGYTPEQIENYFLPIYERLLRKGRNFGSVVDQHRNALNSWKNRFNYNDIVKKA